MFIGSEASGSVIRLDAAGECNRLERDIEGIERLNQSMRMMLEELLGECPVELVHETAIGRRVQKLISDHPLPTATAGDRDGQRSYAG
jgi:hypothetical protein